MLIVYFSCGGKKMASLIRIVEQLGVYNKLVILNQKIAFLIEKQLNMSSYLIQILARWGLSPIKAFGTTDFRLHR
jgi:hypothetical protein